MDTAEIQTLLKLDILIKVVAQAVDATQRGQLEMAEKGFASLDRIADSEPFLREKTLSVYSSSSARGLQRIRFSAERVLWCGRET